MRRVLHWKRALILLGVLVVISAAAAGVHRLQVHRQASTLKERAISAEAEGKNEEAADLLERYLKFQPKDEDAAMRYLNIRFAQAEAEPNSTAPDRAINAGEKYLREFRNHPEERRKLVATYLKVGRQRGEVAKVNAAREHLELLLNDPKQQASRDVELLEMAADLEILAADPNKAVDYLREAIATGSAPISLYSRLIDTYWYYNEIPDGKRKADALARDLLESSKFKKEVAAQVVVTRHRLRSGDETRARELLQDLMGLPGGGSDPEALLVAAELEFSGITRENRTARLQKAQEWCEKAIQSDPTNIRAALFLAETLSQQGKLSEAIAALVRAAGTIEKVNDNYLLVLDKLIDLGDISSVPGMIDRVKEEFKGRSLADYFRGRLALLQAEQANNDPAAWNEARTLLEGSAPFMEHVPALHAKALTGIARCYEVAQNPDRQFENANRALKDNSKYLPALLQRAEALILLGKYPDALIDLKQIVYRYGLNSARAKLARVELLATRSGLGSRNWKDFDAAIGFGDMTPDSPADRLQLLQGFAPDLQLLYAESLLVRAREADANKEPEDALQLRKFAAAVLEKLTEKEPTYATAWLTLGRLKYGEDTNAILGLLDGAVQRAEAKASADGQPIVPRTAIEFRLVRANVLANRLLKPTPAELRALAGGTESFPARDRHRLWASLGNTALAISPSLPAAAVPAMRDFALECFGNAARLDMLDLASRITIIDLAMEAGRSDLLPPMLDQIARVEGPGGPIGSLAQAVVRLPQVRGMPYKDPGEKLARDAAVAEIRTLAEIARKARPGWSRAYVVLGQLDELSGNSADAAAAYKKAIDIGDRQEFVIRRAFLLLVADLKKDEEATKLLNLVAADVALPPDLEQYRVVKNLLSKELPSTARNDIDRIAPADSKDDRVLLLRGALLAATRHDVDAEQAFRKALELNDQVPETWTALISHLVRQGKLAEANSVLKQAEDALVTHAPKDALKKADLILGLAGCYELIRKLDEAEKKYREAVLAAPKELNPHRQLVQFLQRNGRTEKADAMLREMSAREPNLARWARRHRALTIAASPDAYQKLGEAKDLIKANRAANPDDDDDIKADAILLTVDPATRAEGVKILEERYAKWDNLSADEYYLLGQLRFASGDVIGAEQYFARAARPRADDVTLEHMAALVRIYLALSKMHNASKPLDDADAAQRRLELAAPRSWEAAREKARVLHQRSVLAAKANDKTLATSLDNEARNTILNFPEARTEAFILSRSGPLLDELGFVVDAELLYKELLNLSKSDSAHVPLAAFLISHKKTHEAIDLAWKHADTCSPALTARILTGAVRSKRAGPADEQKIEKWLGEQITANASNKPMASLLVGARAELLEAQGDYDQAIDAYERAIALNPERSDVLTNNLCMILALHRPARAGEAIDRMERLIQLRGPVPAFLDTLAVTYLVRGGRLPSGEYAAAIAASKLELALAQRENAAYLFHLAWAYDLMDEKRVLKAEKLGRARDLGITVEDVHPLEAPRFRQLFDSP